MTNPQARFIRFRAAALIQSEGRVLVHVVTNADDGCDWHILPGGGVDYGESSRQALRRELREELGWTVTEEEYAGAFESFHTFNGREEHEISFVYRVAAPEEARPTLEIRERDGAGKVFRWVALETVVRPGASLYPPGLIEAIRNLKR